jgi:hypothetical protein
LEIIDIKEQSVGIRPKHEANQDSAGIKTKFRKNPMKNKMSLYEYPSSKLTPLIVSLLLMASITKSGAAAFTANNIVVLQAAGSASNTNCSIVELNTNTASQTAVQTIPIGVTGTTALRFSSSATSTGYLADSDDGTLLAFTGANTNDGAANVNTYVGRGVGTYNSAGTFNLATTYSGSSGNQTRGAVTVNNNFWFIGDQGGYYTNGVSAVITSGNLRSVKSFGGTVYSFTASASAVPVNTLTAAGTITALPGLGNGASSRQDFYLISSGSNGSTYDTLYVLDATSATAGTIFKYFLVSGSWTANGSYTTSFGGFGLCAIKSGAGAVFYVTTGRGQPRQTVSSNSPTPQATTPPSPSPRQTT